MIDNNKYIQEPVSNLLKFHDNNFQDKPNLGLFLKGNIMTLKIYLFYTENLFFG